MPWNIEIARGKVIAKHQPTGYVYEEPVLLFQETGFFDRAEEALTDAADVVSLKASLENTAKTRPELDVTLPEGVSLEPTTLFGKISMKKGN